jgi:hypothetical protein
MRFLVFAGPTLIGWSHLEQGDAPMGVALGQFFPADAYRASIHTLEGAKLRVSPEDSLQSLETSGGVHITDYSADLGPDGIEISVLGIEADSYQRFFPHHVRAYREQCPPRAR